MGKEALILDPGSCCAGEPVDARCAKRIVSELSQSGYALILPTSISGVERIYGNEERWRTLLLTEQEYDESRFWLYHHATGSNAYIPCQASIPFRSEK